MRYCCCIIAFIVITTAVFLQSARWLAPQLDRARPSIEAYLSEKIDAHVTIGALTAQWYGLRPRLLLNNIDIRQDGQSVLMVEEADFEFDLLHSLLYWQWVWEHLVVNELSLVITQNESGQWLFANTPLSDDGGSSWSHSKPLDMLALAPLVDIRQVNIQLTLSNNTLVPISIPSVTVKNSKTFQRLQASATIQGKQVFSLLLERDISSDGQQLSSTKGHVALDQFPVGTLIAPFLLTSLPLPPLPQELVDLSVWFDIDAAGGVDIAGHIEAKNILGGLFQQYALPGLFLKADVKGHFLPSEGLSVGLRDVYVDDTFFTEQMLFRQVSGQLPSLAIADLELASLSQWLARFLAPLEPVVDVIQPLSLTGSVDHLFIDIDPNNLKASVLSGYAKHIEMKPVKQIPGMANINGYFESRIDQGYINLSSDNFSFFPHTIYDKPIRFDRVHSQIAWYIWPEDNRVVINSGHIVGEGDFGQANATFLLDLPWIQNSRKSDFTLHVGLKNSSTHYHRQFVPNRVPESLRRWLSTSIKKGAVPQAGLIYRGDLSGGSNTRAIQLFIDLEDAELAYSDEWPSLTDTRAQVVINNLSVHVASDQARILDEAVDSLLVSWPHGAERLLSVKANAVVPAQSGLRFLQEGALSDKVGHVLDTWSADGNIDLGVSLAIPITSESAGLGSQRVNGLDALAIDPGADAGLQNTEHQHVNIRFNGNDIRLSNHRIDLQEVKGQLFFNAKQGLSTHNMTALAFGEPVRFALHQTTSSEQQTMTHISGEGVVDAVDLAQWLGQPSVMMLDGRIPYELLIAIPSSDASIPIKIHARSTLQGVELDMPVPLRKLRHSQIPIDVSVVLDNSDVHYGIQYGDHVHFSLSKQEGGSSGVLSVNQTLKKTTNTPVPGEFAIYAALEDVDVQHWSVILERYRQLQSDASFSEVEGALPNIRYMIDIDSLQLGAQQIDDVVVRGRRNDGLWSINVDNSLVKGRMVIDDTFSEPVEVSLDYLNIPSSRVAQVDIEEGAVNAAKDNSDPWGAINFSVMKKANVSIKQLSYKEKSFTNIQFTAEPIVDGLALNDISLSFSQLSVSGDGGKGASLVWRYTDEDNNTESQLAADHLKGRGRSMLSQFSGVITGGDVETLFNDWQLPQVLKSKSTFVDIDVSWQGSPAAFAIEKLSGDTKIEMSQGVFVQSKGQASTGILRLFSLFNFDTWARRLRLDFSDLYKKGIVYDELSVRFNFDQGNIYFQEPLHVISPSSEFSMAGIIDYPRENIDAVLITTLPIGGNLTFAAALAAGLPAAVGVYIVSKIFKPQVDRASSLTYSVKGEWAKPEVKFIKLFGTSLDPANPAKALSDQEENNGIIIDGS